MSRIVPIPYRKLVRALELEGFVLDRQRGDHMMFTKPGISRPVVIPRDDPVPVFIIKNNLRTAGISREEYFRLLDQI
jgi:predicted RNA binding protein YcfA (HicA-like mRNA interferase family)